MAHSMKNVVELSVGKFDAVRTLRDCLSAAERGEIKHVVVICTDALLEGEADDGQDIWASWSQMQRHHVLWLVRWLNSYVNQRYFGKYHNDD